jgi:hypothetical protein
MLLLVTVLSVYSCKDKKRRNEVAKMVREWTGREILFPENVPCYVAGKEMQLEFCSEWFEKEYKILMYVDSAGCSDCRLKLFEWRQLMAEADSLFQGKVGFLLFFQPKIVRKMAFLFARDRFDEPVFMDINGSINRLNRFPKAMEYQCFLLDRDNRVLMMGNPVLNMQIWKLYKSQIAGGKKTDPEMLTAATAEKTVHEYGSIPTGSSNPAVFTITNTGSHPLVIYRVSASCGCTRVDWTKQPVQPGQAASVSVEMTPDEAGYFSKTIDVYCNVKDSPIRLTVTGTANE